jgi:hypothetical protein
MSDDDFTDPDFVLGAVLAQIEDLTPDEQRAVLTEALAAIGGTHGASTDI